jgi:hypothetical protein
MVLPMAIKFIKKEKIALKEIKLENGCNFYNIPQIFYYKPNSKMP